MPKLPAKTAKKVDSAEGSSFDALPEGRYIGTLMEVEVKEGPKGPYWSWRFSDLENESGDSAPGSQWVNTSLSENAFWKMKELFDAFGVSADTDTDELCGKRAALIVTQRVIEKGNRAGEIGNNVDRVLPVDHVADDDDDDEVPF